MNGLDPSDHAEGLLLEGDTVLAREKAGLGLNLGRDGLNNRLRKRSESGASKNPVASALGKGLSFSEDIHTELERKDLRDLDVFTIDPPTARDLDDGISIRTFRVTRSSSSSSNTASANGKDDTEMSERFSLTPVTAAEAITADENFKNFGRGDEILTEVGVHIGDVSHYVRGQGEGDGGHGTDGGAANMMDLEAQRRTTTVYLPHRGYHMIPPALSTATCSLLPDEEKMAMSVFWLVDRAGKMVESSEKVVFDKQAYPHACTSRILSKKRYAYDDVDNILKN